jgi:hypothetical protein
MQDSVQVEVKTMKTIHIRTDNISMQAELNENPTSLKIWEALPIEGRANLWGAEIYFEIPVDAEVEPDARQEVEISELGYWPAGHAFCIFFGPTPISRDAKPRAYSPVNILGRVLGDATQFRTVTNNQKVTLERVE